MRPAAGATAGLALLVFVTCTPARAAGEAPLRLEAGASASLIAGGASNAYLRPGPQRPEATFLLSPRPFVGLRSERLAAHLAYAPAFQHSVASGVTGWFHDGRVGLRWSATETLILDAVVSAALVDYAGEGAPVDEGTLDLVSTRARSLGAGAGVWWRPEGPFALRAAVHAGRRHSTSVIRSGGGPEPIDDLRVEGLVNLSYRLSSTAGIWAGPLAEVREANRVRLSFWGFGAELGGRSRLWRSGGLEGSVRAQRNTFGGLMPRDDLFARLSFALWQDLGEHARLGLRYAYTANGSAVAAYDADRHLVVLALSLRTPTWTH